MHSLELYLGIQLIPFVLMECILPIVIVLFFCAKRYTKLKTTRNIQLQSDKCTCSYLSWAEWCHTVLQKMGEHWLHFVLRHEFKREGDEYILKGCKLSKWYVHWVSFMPVSVALFALITFWDIFLVQESQDCLPDVDCFFDDYTNSSSSSQLTTMPLNCSEVTTNDEDNIICYKFALNISIAVAAAGGVLTISTIAMAISLSVATAISSRCSTFWVFIAMIIASILLPIGFIVGFIVFVVTNDHFTLGKITPLMQLFIVFFAIFCTLGIFPWFSTKKISETEDDGNLCPPCFRCKYNCCAPTSSEDSSDRDANLTEASALVQEQ